MRVIPSSASSLLGVPSTPVIHVTPPALFPSNRPGFSDVEVASSVLLVCALLVCLRCFGLGGASEEKSVSVASVGSEGHLSRRKASVVAVVASLPCLLDGVHFAVTSGVLLRLDAGSSWSIGSRAFIVGGFQLGQIVSTVVCPAVTKHFGRHRTLFLVSVGQVVGFCVLALWPASVAALIGGRIVAGICMGQIISPIYISEVMPPSMRGSGVSWVESMTNFGSLVAIVGHILCAALPLRCLWSVFVVLALVSVVAVSHLPRDRMPSVVVEALTAADEEKWFANLRPPTVAGRNGFLLACVLGFLQQCSGEDALYGYCEQIALRAGLGRPALFGVALAALTFMCNLASSGVIDLVGRRALLLCGMLAIGAAWMAASVLLAQGLGATVVLASVLGFEFIFALSLGPGYYVVASEVLADSHRVQGLSASLFINRVTSCVMVLTFELNRKLFSLAGTFVIYAVFMLGGACFIYWKLPETAGRSFYEIQHLLDPAVAELSVGPRC